MKMYIIETSRRMNGRWTHWAGVEFCSTFEQAQKAIAYQILGQLNREDRGEEYEREWETLSERSKSAMLGEEFEFDERKWRIAEEQD